MTPSTHASSGKSHSTPLSTSTKGRKRIRSKDNTIQGMTEEAHVQLFLPQEHAIGISSEVEHILCETLLSHLANEEKPHTQEEEHDGHHHENRSRGSSHRGRAPTTTSRMPSRAHDEGGASQTSLPPPVPFSCATSMVDWLQKTPPSLSSPAALFGSASTVSGKGEGRSRACYHHFHQCMARVVMQDSLQNTEAASASSLRSAAFLCKLLATVPEMVEDPFFWRAPTIPAPQSPNPTLAGASPVENGAPASSSRGPAKPHEDTAPSMSWMNKGDLFAILLSTVVSPAACATTVTPLLPHALSPPPLPEKKDKATGEDSRHRGPPPAARQFTTMNPIGPHERMELAELYLLLSSGPWATESPSQWGRRTSGDAADHRGHTLRTEEDATVLSHRRRLEGSRAPPPPPSSSSSSWEEAVGTHDGAAVSKTAKEAAGDAGRWEPLLLCITLRGITQMLQSQLLRLHDEGEAEGGPLVSSTSSPAAHEGRPLSHAAESNAGSDAPSRSGEVPPPPPPPPTILSIIQDAICHTHRLPTHIVAEEHQWTAAAYREAIHQALHLYFTAIGSGAAPPVAVAETPLSSSSSRTFSAVGKADATPHPIDPIVPDPFAPHARQGSHSPEEEEERERVADGTTGKHRSRLAALSISPAPSLPTPVQGTPPSTTPPSLPPRTLHTNENTPEKNSSPPPPPPLLHPTAEETKKQEAIAKSILALDAFHAEQEEAEMGGGGGKRHPPLPLVSRTAPTHGLAPALLSSSSTTTPSFASFPPSRPSLEVEDIEEYSDSADDNDETKARMAPKGRPGSVGDHQGAIPRRPLLASATTNPTHAPPSSAAGAPFSIDALYPLLHPSPSRHLPRRPTPAKMVPTTPTLSTFRPRPPTREGKKSRASFTPEEDKALLSGVARFPGCTMDDFRTIFDMFPNVWCSSRTPHQLRDHWRQALKKRVELQHAL